MYSQPQSNAQSGLSQYQYSYSAGQSVYYPVAGGNWQQAQTSTAPAHGWVASTQPQQPAQSWPPPAQTEEPPPPGTGSDTTIPGAIGGAEDTQSAPPPPPPQTETSTPAPWQTSSNYWQPWQTQGSWGGVNQWNGQWPPQSTYWTVPYNYGNHNMYGHVQPVSKSQHQDGVYSGVTGADRTPPPPHQDATPPPPAEEQQVHQPRIQQYSQTGYATELPPVPQSPLAPPLPAPATPTPQATTYSEKKEQATILGTQPSELPVKKEGGLLPVPHSQVQTVPYHKPVSQYGQPWGGGRERPDVHARAKKRRSRWEQQPEAAVPAERQVMTGQEHFPPQAPAKKPKASPPPPPPLTPEQWPPKLRDYINRAFAACEGRVPDLEKVQQFLKVELNEIFRQNRAWDVDWDNRPLPLGHQAHNSRWDAPSPSHSDAQTWQPYQPVTPTVGGREPGGGRGKRKRGGTKRKRGGKLFFIDKTGEEMTEQEQRRLDKRAQRFATTDGNCSYKKKLSVAELVQAATAGLREEGGDLDWEEFATEGTSQALEKPYLRLTSAPDPSAVRPQNILRQSLTHVMGKWQEKRDYRYTCEQLKSIRQDLTIQGVRNEFAVTVYESHARIALENGDRGEFNQCQAQLKALYREGVAGQEPEFVAYRVLYLIMTHNSADMSTELRELAPNLRTHPHIAHALKLWSSWQLGNYCQFFRYFKIAPGSGRSLLELFLSRERLSALKMILKAFRPDVPVAYVAHTLAFPSSDECMEWLAELGLPLSGPSTALDCKACLPLVQAKATSS